MKKLDEDTALAILFANTRRKKRNENWVTIARACHYLVGLYGSQKAVAEKVGLSGEMIREFLTVLKLPKTVQDLISKRVIDSIDVAREISALKDRTKQVEAARVLTASSSEDVRDVKRLVKISGGSIEGAKKAVISAKPKPIHIFLLDMDEQMYREIARYAGIRKVKPADLVRTVIEDWLRRKMGRSYKGGKE